MNPRRTFSAGFTLIELVVAMLVVTILTSIAAPSYLNYVRKSRRVEAKTALLDLAGREERYFNTNASYTNLANNLGYAAAANPLTNLPVGSGYYQVTVTVPAGNGLPAPSYQITATPLTVDQQKDTNCAWFSDDSTGNQQANTVAGGGGTVTTTSCW